MSPERRRILEQLGDDDAIFFEPGMDPAIIGLSQSQPGRQACVVYDYQKLVTYFRDQGMSYEEAEEGIANTLGIWMGDTTPIVIERLKHHA